MEIALIAALFFAAALIYSAVGHGGASAYLAIMALLNFAPDEMKPLSLCLNLVVSALAFWRFSKVGAFDLRLFLPLVFASIPMAFIGGMMKIDPALFKQILGVILILSAASLLFKPMPRDEDIRAPNLPIAGFTGAGLGLVAGLTGTGGGIFLSPLLILLRWVQPKKSAGIAAAFVFSNSAAGLAGNIKALGHLPSELPIYVAAVAVGGMLGAQLSAVKLPRERMVHVLAIVLLIASYKLILA